MRTDHDREDLIELPEFMNIASDQGLLSKPEEVDSLSETEPPLSPALAACLSAEEPERNEVQVEGAPKTEIDRTVVKTKIS